MKRRNFVLLASAGVVATSIPAIQHLFYQIPNYDRKLAKPEMLSLIWDDETIETIGAKYQDSFPDEGKERALARALFADPTHQSAEKLVQLTQNDFAEERTVTIDGWVLSKTEARQCALCHLLHAKS